MAPFPRHVALFFLAGFIMTNTATGSDRRWTIERTDAWFSASGPLRGFNFLPRTAINSVEMWQSDTFDPATIVEELGWAADAYFNSARVFLPFVVWEADPSGFKDRLTHFLQLADKHRISVMPVLFDDCAFSGLEPELGPQGSPVPAVHNSGWVGSPGRRRQLDPAYLPALEAYVRDILTSYLADRRIVCWDLYNEPGNSGMGMESLPLLEAVFQWARAVDPQQPLTSGSWQHQPASPLNRVMFDNSDVISFHAYENALKTGQLIGNLALHGRPLLCTEWLHRINGNSYEAILPVFAASNTGWYQWGLVEGRTQTYLPWKQNLLTAPLGLWQHDVFHADGKAYDEHEMALLRELISAAK